MKVLVSKLGALGDLIHSLPAVTDASKLIPGIRFDWIVEEAFGEIPAWHPKVDRVIHWSSRRWRKGTSFYHKEILSAVREIRRERYDVVIDAQGILKATLPALLAKGPLWGYDKSMIGDRFAASLYKHKFCDNRDDVHASALVRGLFAHALGYDTPLDHPDPGIAAGFKEAECTIETDKNTLILLHGTTWENKHLPMHFWRDIIAELGDMGWQILMPALGERERKRADELAGESHIRVLPALSLSELAILFARSGAVIGPDTGLCHVAAAVGAPTLVMFGPSKEFFYRPLGAYASTYQVDMDCAPCMLKQCPKVEAEITPPCWSTVSPAEAVSRLVQQVTQYAT